MKYKKIITLVAFGIQLIGFGVTNVYSEVKPSKDKINQTPKQFNGGYELADVLIWAMPKQVNGNNSLPNLQDYNQFKGVVSKIETSNRGYTGQVLLLADKKQTVPENISDSYDWSVSIEGPRAGASSIAFSSGFLGDGPDIGPKYLRKNKINLIALSCFSSGGTPNNATALYLMLYPGKSPTLLSYSVGTGSAGRTLKYKLHYDGIEWSDVPGAKEVDYKGDTQNFALCPYPDLL